MSKLEDFFGKPGGSGTGTDPDAVNKYAADRVMPGSFKTTKPTAQTPVLQVIFPTVPVATLVTVRGYLTCSKASAEYHDFTLTGVQAPISGVSRSDQAWGNAAGRVLDFNVENATTIPATTLRFKLGYNAVKKPLLEISGHVLASAGDGQLVITSISYSGLADVDAPKSGLDFAEVAVSSIATVANLVTKNAANEKHKHSATEVAPTELTDTQDLNALVIPGEYFMPRALANWAALNYPSAPPCSVTVFKTDRPGQIVRPRDGAVREYFRTQNSGNVFAAWDYADLYSRTDTFRYRGQVTSLEGTNTRYPGHYDILPGNSGPLSTQYGHMIVTSNGTVTGTGSFVQQTIYYHDGTICTRKIVNSTGSAWSTLHQNTQPIDNTQGIRCSKASNPYYEWHIPGSSAVVAYLNSSAQLVFGTSNGAGVMAAQTLLFDNRGSISVNGARWAASWQHSYAAQYGTLAPFHVDFGAVGGASDYYPVVRGKCSASGYGYTTQVELGMLRNGGAAWGQGVLMVCSGEGASPMAQFYFTISGDIIIPGEMTFRDYTITCDRKFKTNPQRIENPLDKLADVNGYTYTNQVDEEDSGLISNEWEWLPGATKRKPLLDKHGNYVEGEEYLSLRIKGPVGYLLECIKAQQEIIQAQRVQLAKIEKHLGLEESGL